MSRLKVKQTELTSGAVIGVANAACREDIVAQVSALAADPDIAAIEWRSDEYENIFEITFREVPAALEAIRAAAKDKPLMFSFRDAVIGGKHPAKYMYIARLAVMAAKEGADLISAPLLPYEDASKSIIFEAANHGKKSVLTFIYSDRMPDKDELIRKLDEMKEYAADAMELGAPAKDEKDEALFRKTLEEYARENQVEIIMSVLNGDGVEKKIVL